MSRQDTLTPETVAAAVSRLALMAFFPGDPEVRAGLIPIFLGMIDTEEHLDWLVARALQLFPRWPGVAEIRALYCSRFKPKDGVEGYSEIYENFPSPQPAPLPPGRETTADAAFDKQIQDAAALKRLPGSAAARPRRVK